MSRSMTVLLKTQDRLSQMLRFQSFNGAAAELTAV